MGGRSGHIRGRLRFLPRGWFTGEKGGYYGGVVGCERTDAGERGETQGSTVGQGKGESRGRQRQKGGKATEGPWRSRRGERNLLTRMSG